MTTKTHARNLGAAVAGGFLALAVSIPALADDAGYNLPSEQLDRARSYDQAAPEIDASNDDQYASYVTGTDDERRTTRTEARQEEPALTESERLWRHWDEQVSRGR